MENPRHHFPVFLGVFQFVFGRADEGMHRVGVDLFLVPLEVPEAFLDEGFLVRLVVNGEPGLVAQFVGVEFQDAAGRSGGKCR